MFLLNDLMILNYKEKGHIDIEEMLRSNLHPTYYYFRLGKYVKLWNSSLTKIDIIELGEAGSEILIIPAKGYALIQSLERFICSKKIVAFFSQISALPRRGLKLNHSMSIDPNFRGFLEMGLENILNVPIEIEYGENIGKILFFDISDTYPINDIKGTISEKEYERREHLKGSEPITQA